MGLTDDEVWQLVSFLRSLGGGSNEKITGNVAAGELIFTGIGDCLACHMVNGQGARWVKCGGDNHHRASLHTPKSG